MKKFVWFRGIRVRLLSVALLPIVGFVIASYVAFTGLDKVGGFLNSAHKEIIPGTRALNQLVIARNKYGYHIWAAIGLSDHPELMKQRLDMARSAKGEWVKTFDTFASYSHREDELENFNFINSNKDRYLGMLDKVIALVETGNPESIEEAKNLLVGEIWKVGSDIAKNNGSIVSIYEKRAEAEGVESEKTEKNVYFWTIVVNSVVSLVILVVIIFISSRIANVIAGISAQLSAASGNVTNSVQQLNAAGNSLSQSSTEAAASLEETVASLEELSSMVQTNSSNAREASTLSTSSRAAAERGEKEIRSLIESMGKISDSSKKIEEIISVIDDLAFQTNLLALNAAVEAARAGEQGKGFAVVADAVRALAQKSADSAKDISNLIQESAQHVHEGGSIADRSGEVLAEIVEAVKKVSVLNEEIASASLEQSTGIQQIGKAMNQLDQASQANAASAEEIAATSGEINVLAATAEKLTEDLNTVIMGKNDEAA